MTLVAFLLAVGAAATTGIIFPPGAWYEGLKRPEFTPPRIAFPIVWTVLYVLIALAGARLAERPDAGVALSLWAAQIALNTLWTPVFFGAHRVGLALAVIAVLWVTVAALVVAAFMVDLVAGFLLMPYLIWLCVAVALNWRIWRDNPVL